MFGNVFGFFKRKKENVGNENLKTKISYHKIEKVNEESFLEEDYSLDIVTITKNRNEFEFVVNFTNDTNEHIRINILKIQLIHDGREYNGDSLIYEMNMGTNDVVLKNTVIAKGTLLKNIMFKDLQLTSISGDDYIIIELLINNSPSVLEISINNSVVDQIKVVEIERN